VSNEKKKKITGKIDNFIVFNKHIIAYLGYRRIQHCYQAIIDCVLTELACFL
jgi:hypothetical protein